MKEVKFVSSGDIDIKITVPYEYRAEATKFGDAYGLLIDIRAARHYFTSPTPSDGPDAQ